MPVRAPDDVARPYTRIGSVGENSLLSAGAATANSTVNWTLRPVRGAARLRVRLKTASQAGTLDIVFVGPDWNTDQAYNTAYASLLGTKHSTGNPAQVVVTAGAEATITADCYGESYALIVFTGTTGGPGTITYCDVCQL